MKSHFRIGMAIVAMSSVTVLAQARMFLIPRGGVGNQITVTPGTTVTVDVFIENFAPDLIFAYQCTMPFSASGGFLGTVNHDGTTPVIDEARADYLFFGLTPALISKFAGPPPRVLNSRLNPAEAVLVTTPIYLAEFRYVASANAVGSFTVKLLGNTGDLGALTIVSDQSQAALIFPDDPAIINILCTGNAQCNDGLFCNGVESCAAGICVSGTAPCPQPGLPFCDENLNACVECLNASVCNDGNECTSDICSAGACSTIPRSAGSACGSAANTDCTNPDQCDGLGNCDANDELDGTTCNDGEFCTTGESCTAGVCGGIAPTDCSDAFACTTDTCDEVADECVNELDAGACLIDDVCYNDGQPNPANECEECNSALATTSWSFAADGTGCTDDGNDCTADECQAGLCEHPNLDPGDPCNDGNPCTGTGAPGVGIDTCDGAGNCSGVLDPDCADDCPNAVEAVDGLNTGTNVAFGPDDAEASCQPNSNHDAWFKYTALCDGEVHVTTRDSVFLPSNDTVLSVFDACGGTEVACDDDSGIGLLSSLTFMATGGITYSIRVAGFDDNQGDIALYITRMDSCFVNDECHVDGAENPLNSCEVCDAGEDPFNWTPRIKGTPCGDPSFAECDNPNACDGVGNCEDNFKPDGTLCTADANDCTFDICVSGVCDHPNKPSGTDCGSPLDTECDNPDTCDGLGLCADNLEPSGFACGDPTDTDCDNPDTCDGIGECLLNMELDDTPCTDDLIDCTFDLCLVGVCDHPNKPPGTACGDGQDTQCDNPDTCDGTGGCLENKEPDGLFCDDSNVCTEPDACDDGQCVGPFIPEAPIVSTLGPRRLEVTAQPAGSDIPQALRVTSPDYPCLLQYVSATGELVGAPVFQTPIVWGTLTVTGAALVPSSEYHIAAECNGELSAAGVGLTSGWGDLDANGTVNLDDLFCILNAFVDDFSTCSMADADIHPCTPNGTINLNDLFYILGAFLDEEFPCASPCGGGACCIGTSCFIRTASQCATEGGAFEGDGQNCDTNPCAPFAASGQSGQSDGEFTGTTIFTRTSDDSVPSRGILTFDVFADRVVDLGGFQIGLEVHGGRTGSLRATSGAIQADRSDYVFAGQQVFSAVDNVGGRAAAIVDGAGVTSDGATYLGSFSFEALRGSSGTFTITPRVDNGVILLDSLGHPIEWQGQPTTVTIGPRLDVDAKSMNRGR